MAVTLVMVVGYVLSFVKEAIIANYYGVSYLVDAYTIAITIPVTLFAVVSVAIQSICVPIYSDILYKENIEQANLYISRLLSAVSLIAIIFITICEFAASPLIYFFAPGFDTITHELATKLLRICLPIVLFTIIDKVFISLLNVHKQFILPSFAIYILNIILIASVVILNESIGIVAACFGQVLGGFLELSYLYFLARKYYKFQFKFEIKDKHIVKSLKNSIPIMWSISIAEICATINRAVASFLFVGSIAALGYAAKLNSVLISFFTAAVSTIVYPLFAESTAQNNLEQLNKRVNFILSAYTFFLVPLMLWVFCYKSEIVEIVFARGAFNQSAIDITQSLFGCYVAGLLFMAFRETITKVFYSLHDTKTPAVNATIGVFLNIVLNLTLPFIIGVEGLAIATSITACVISIRLIYQLIKNNVELSLKTFWPNVVKIIVASFLMFVILKVVADMMCDSLAIFRLLVGVFAALISYFTISYFFNIPILAEVHKMFISKNKKE